MDSLGSVHHVQIRRTTDRIRAAYDRPDAEETRVFQEMLDTWRGTDPEQVVEHQVVIRPDSVAYYRPIFIQSPTCLKCHGTPENGLDSTALVRIRERYPNDAATGYALGDLRGMWSIRWAR